MTSTSPAPIADHPATLTRDDMERLVTEGRAQPWTRDLRGDLPQAALVDGAWESTNLASGTWYVVPAEADEYHQATPELAEILTRDAARLRAADEAVADIDARTGP